MATMQARANAAALLLHDVATRAYRYTRHDLTARFANPEGKVVHIAERHAAEELGMMYGFAWSLAAFGMEWGTIEGVISHAAALARADWHEERRALIGEEALRHESQSRQSPVPLPAVPVGLAEADLG